MKHSQVAVLAIAAHPDDIELSCAGLLLHQKKLGYTTGIVDLTGGELGSRGSKELRQKETEAASKVLELDYRSNLGLPDGGICGSEPDPLAEKSQTARVVKLLRELRPEILVVPYWEERHPDHVETSKLVTRSVFYAGLKNYHSASGKPYQPRQVLYFQMRYDFTPNFVVDTTPYQEQKLAAINCYSSQVIPTTLDEERHVLVAAPLSLSALDARDRTVGALIGVEYGEGFVVKSPLRLLDPVAHFRSADTSTPLLYRTSKS